MDYQSIFERVESKYVLTGSQYENLRNRIQDRLQEDLFPHSDISSIYFDTDNYRLARAALEKPAYREKLRLRSYGMKDDSSEVFMELKKKYLGVIYKRRRAMSYHNAMNYILFGRKPDNTQIVNEIDYMMKKYPDLKPRVLISYERDSYVVINDSNIRITFDYNVRYSLDNVTLKNNKAEKQLTGEDTVIMEIKSLNAMPLWLTEVLDEMNIFPGNYSKYGQIYTDVIMKGAKKCYNSYSHQYIQEPLPLRYSSSARLHQSF
ncbi:MAG: polyphosphate polymerase domain-containing protein [Erysipelotrichaceae bacterium]|nr:polyphosphate polymerase domain-containing protein [Erysipelotrichaceae bacterium]